MRTKEYVSIMRKVFAREAPLTHQGEHYQIPYAGAGSTGLGRPLKSVMPASPDIKIYTAAIAPAGLRTGGEVADGGLPFFMSPEKTDLIVKPILEGMAKAPTKKTLADFDVAPYVRIRMGDDIEACRDGLRSELALYIGGMGARDKNFYNDLARRMGYEGAAKKVQDLFLDGKRREAAAVVPNELIDEMSLIGSASRIKDRLHDWKSIAADGRVGTMVLSGATVEAARVVAEAVL
jgi:alkanesulfonate monooxygenase SsuD/methylene tetrahydromethanopterin reductase-like flavin-dependent oxidoreductase (luciferase family)